MNLWLPKEVEGTIDLVLATVSLISNGTIITAVVLSLSLQTSVNIFVVNLAVTDFLLSLAAIVHSFSFLVNGDFPGLNTICAIDVALAQICVGCSIFTLASLSVNRYVVITKSTETYNLIFRRWLIALWIVLLWVLSAAATLLPLHFMVGELGYDHKNEHCDALLDQDKAELYNCILAVAYFPIPLVTVIFCYANIYLHVRRHNQKLRRQLDLQRGSNEAIDASSHGNNNSTSNETGMSVKEIQITKSLFLILCVFVAFLTPHAICSFFEKTNHFTRRLVALNSLINPFIYGIGHPNIRKVLKCMFMGKPIPEPSPLAKRLCTVR